MQHPSVAFFTIEVDDAHRGVGFHTAAGNPADADDAHVTVVVQRADLHLERSIHIHIGRVHHLDDGLEQRRHITAMYIWCQSRVTV